MHRKFNNGTTVYVNSTWNQEEECIVTGYVENESSTGKNVYKVNSQVNGGTFGATEDCVFATKEEAHKASIETSAKLVQKYKSEIKTLKDLIAFPLNHCISCGEEYIDWEAQRAYRLRANELIGVVLENIG